MNNEKLNDLFITNSHFESGTISPNVKVEGSAFPHEVASKGDVAKALEDIAPQNIHEMEVKPIIWVDETKVRVSAFRLWDSTGKFMLEYPGWEKDEGIMLPGEVKAEEWEHLPSNAYVLGVSDGKNTVIRLSNNPNSLSGTYVGEENPYRYIRRIGLASANGMKYIKGVQYGSDFFFEEPSEFLNGSVSAAGSEIIVNIFTPAVGGKRIPLELKINGWISGAGQLKINEALVAYSSSGYQGFCHSTLLREDRKVMFKTASGSLECNAAINGFRDVTLY